MRNIYAKLMIKMLSENKKIYIFSPDLRCMHRQMFVHHATLLVVEIADRFLAKLYMGNILLSTKNRRSKFFCLFLKETWICFNHNIAWQLFHRRPALGLNISTPLTFWAISKLTPQNQASYKIVPPSTPPPPPPHFLPDVINDRSLKTFQVLMHVHRRHPLQQTTGNSFNA